MIKVVVSSAEIVERQGLTKEKYSREGAIVPGGRPWHMRLQSAHAFTVSPDGVVAPFPDKFEITLDNGRLADPDNGIKAIPEQAPFAPGVYQLSPSAVFISREGRMEIRPRLTPVAAGKA